MTRIAGGLWRKVIAVQVYGANTGVGKTIASTLIGAHFSRRKGPNRWNVNYIKPVSTGPSQEADDRYVNKYAKCRTTTLFQYAEAVSPHIAAEKARSVPSDDHVLAGLSKQLELDAQQTSHSPDVMGFSLVETAGGVLSPGPSGTPQADLFRPLRLPVILVGDHRLGGISATISSCESLRMRGYDVDAVICFKDEKQYGNAEYLQGRFDRMGISTCTLPWIPNLEGCNELDEETAMRDYYDATCQTDALNELADCVIDKHFTRLQDLESLAKRTRQAIWHPFTQHSQIRTDDEILVFDSAHGDHFQVKHTPISIANSDNEKVAPVLYPAFDGSASWWTQGLGHGNSKLSLEAAYAAGRYGHVMFAGATHKPAVELAERLLRGLENPRLRKVFYTDDGSTGVEVGIKMGLRATCKRYGWDGSTEDIGVIGLKGSYHGDTIGAMEASEPSVYNKKVDWYRGRGYWFDYPQVKLRHGRWAVEAPTGMEEAFGPPQYFDELEDVFDIPTRNSSTRYEAYIRKTIDNLIFNQGRKFGALIMEPVLMGAGGMIFVDPLFQRCLVDVVRSYNFSPRSTSPTSLEGSLDWSGLPVVFDEVFVGLNRLGRFSAATFLQVHPDISVHAKLLTGGLLPLAVTCASNSIFEAFLSNSKSDALLHGHSYTAHAMGCHIADQSLEMMDQIKSGMDWQAYQADWTLHQAYVPGAGGLSSGKTQERTSIWSMWSKETVMHLSKLAQVDYVISLGSVLVVSLKDSSGSGYTSNAAIGLRDNMLYNLQREPFGIHSRVLGNVLYLMASMNSRPSHLAAVERVLLGKLD
ncbi:bifunctional dethiobiotin synthetase/adenosylmethionine-8-amino-7-oxononanoate aminotransferase [Polyplosphaeria fusca]|uniref:Bifunctional dethiobiotin synthetase/adenosylmethionine-8-amino-7-oxononanoate aminotransferase n=1 Tax=Polyplosphaeria fusca TaxID=682080 RepID=A0A9P4V6Y7_9PLEO|nr:bifunctional dethiobiotin synthetase/adenosylmethionine-8-amino-7-oxononanoate aminotransferase [Polyplosphaeria fusca]